MEVLIDSVVYTCSFHQCRPCINCGRRHEIGSKTLKCISFPFHKRKWVKLKMFTIQHLLLETSSLYHLLFTYFFFSKYIWSISLPSISRTCVASWRNHTELQKPAENKKQLRIHFLYLYYNPPERTAFLSDLASCRGSLDSQSFLTQPACHLGLDSLGFIFSFCLSRDSNWNARCRTLIWTWHDWESPECLHLLELGSSVWNQGPK